MNKNFWVALVAFLLGVGITVMVHENIEEHVLIHADGPVTIDGKFKNKEQCLNKLEAIMAPGPQQSLYQCVEVN